MIRFFLVIVLSLVFIRPKAQSEYIVIKHIGEQSKPLYPITIIRNGSDTSRLKHYVMFEDIIKPEFNYKNSFDSSVFKLIAENMFKEKRKKKIYNNDFIFGSFKVTYYKNQKKSKEFFLLGTSESIRYFEALSHYLNTLNNNQYSKLEYFLCSLISRLTYKSPKVCGEFIWKME